MSKKTWDWSRLDENGRQRPLAEQVKTCLTLVESGIVHNVNDATAFERETRHLLIDVTPSLCVYDPEMTPVKRHYKFAPEAKQLENDVARFDSQDGFVEMLSTLHPWALGIYGEVIESQADAWADITRGYAPRGKLEEKTVKGLCRERVLASKAYQELAATIKGRSEEELAVELMRLDPDVKAKVVYHDNWGAHDVSMRVLSVGNIRKLLQLDACIARSIGWEQSIQTIHVEHEDHEVSELGVDMVEIAGKVVYSSGRFDKEVRNKIVDQEMDLAWARSESLEGENLPVGNELTGADLGVTEGRAPARAAGLDDYETYQLDWMRSRGVSVEDVLKAYGAHVIDTAQAALEQGDVTREELSAPDWMPAILQGAYWGLEESGIEDADDAMWQTRDEWEEEPQRLTHPDDDDVPGEDVREL